jgi:hypothetical protein
VGLVGRKVTTTLVVPLATEGSVRCARRLGLYPVLAANVAASFSGEEVATAVPVGPITGINVLSRSATARAATQPRVCPRRPTGDGLIGLPERRKGGNTFPRPVKPA